MPPLALAAPRTALYRRKRVGWGVPGWRRSYRIKGTKSEVSRRVGSTVMEAAIRNAIPGIVAECGGACACATCHVYVDEAFMSLVGDPQPMEEDMLDLPMTCGRVRLPVLPDPACGTSSTASSSRLRRNRADMARYGSRSSAGRSLVPSHRARLQERRPLVVVAAISDGGRRARRMRALCALWRDPRRRRGAIEAVRRDDRGGLEREGLQWPAAGAARKRSIARSGTSRRNAGARPAWQLAGIAEPKPVTTAFTLSLGTPGRCARPRRAAAFARSSRSSSARTDDAARNPGRAPRRARSRLIVDANEGWTAETSTEPGGLRGEAGVETDRAAAAGRRRGCPSDGRA